ncbi:MAG: VOC family protein [Anaerolineaceae bacterium]|nr:VOC family protein [Anaerolineaceae bacterium]
MSTKIFVNLPVKDLNRSVEFFKNLNFTFNSQFTDENATMMVVGEDIYVMLLVEKFFKTFTSKEIVDTSQSTEVIISLSAGSHEEVDRLADLALQAGGKPSGAAQEMDGMYVRGFEDPDGHLWEVAYMQIPDK